MSLKVWKFLFPSLSSLLSVLVLLDRNLMPGSSPPIVIGPCFFYVLYMEAVGWYIAYTVRIAESIGEMQ